MKVAVICMSRKEFIEHMKDIGALINRTEGVGVCEDMAYYHVMTPGECRGVNFDDYVILKSGLAMSGLRQLEDELKRRISMNKISHLKNIPLKNAVVEELLREAIHDVKDISGIVIIMKNRDGTQSLRISEMKSADLAELYCVFQSQINETFTTRVKA